MKRWVWVCACAVVAGCAAPLVSTLPAEPPRLDLVGRGVPALPMAEADAQLASQAADLARRLPTAVVRRQGDGNVFVRIAAAELFESRSAQLRPAALAPCSELAASLLAHESSVLHVLVLAEATDEEPETALGARRAASLVDELARRGVPPTRLRAEHRWATGGADRVVLIVRPVILGQEPRAWTPPADVDG